jgi:hypothetical protein
MVKKRSETATGKKTATSKDADLLADQLADRKYGEPILENETMTRTTISLPESMLIQLEDITRVNKRTKQEPNNVSALVRLAIDSYLINNNS